MRRTRAHRDPLAQVFNGAERFLHRSAQMDEPTIHARALQRAADAVGGEARLAKALHSSRAQTHRWIVGQEYPPTEIYHKALDLLIGTGGY